jgi:hypothetical protein
MGAFTFAQSQDDTFPVPLADVERQPGMTCYGQLLRLTSEGSVGSPPPTRPCCPEIRPNWMTTPEDRTAALNMIRYMRRYMSRPALARYDRERSLPRRAA